MSSPSPLKSDWAIGDDFAPPDANDVATTVNWLLGQSSTGGSAHAYGEVPAGAHDGVNETFTLAHPFVTGSTCVYRNGLRERLGVGYTESSPTIIFTSPVLSTDVIEVDYMLA